MILENALLHLQFLINSKNKITFLRKRISDLLLEKQEEIVQAIGTDHFEDTVRHSAKEMKRVLPKRIYAGLNTDIFFRTVRKSLIHIDDKPAHIRTLFDEYIRSLNKRLYLTLGNNMLKERLREKKKMDGDIDLYEAMEDTQSILSNKVYSKEKYHLQIELLKMQEWIKANDKRLLILFEGRDAAGKGSCIKRFIEHLNTKHFRVETFGVPTEHERAHWFGRYEKILPKPGEIVFFDRSWYTRAVTEPTMGYCTAEEYETFMHDVLPFEHRLVDDGLYLIKFWFSITKQKQQYRFMLRQKSPLKYWKYSPNDQAAMHKWEDFTRYKETMFQRTSSKKSPWIVVDGNDKKVARLNAMRYVLNVIPYDNKDAENLEYFTEVVYPVGINVRKRAAVHT